MDEETRAFLSQHFAAIDQRFDAMQGEFRQLVEENRRHSGVLAEDLRADPQDYRSSQSAAARLP
jgi:predicted RNA-binding protein